MGQFVDSDVIEDCIDVVQYAIGRRDKASGFISFEERRATFKNPCQLPENILFRVHIIFATSYLKDLVPLSLDEGDAMSTSLLNTLLLRFKYTLMEDVCRGQDLLPRAFREAVAAGTSESLYSLADFVFDTSKTIKNSMITLDSKEELYALFVQGGFFTFANALLNHAIKSYEVRDPGTVAATVCVLKDGDEVVAAETAIQATCETINHCVRFLSGSRENLLTESAMNPQRSTLSLLMKLITVVRKVATLQAVYDAILGAAVGLRSLLIPVTPAERAQRSDVVRFWVEGSGVEKPPLFLVASSLAQLLSLWATTTTIPSLPKQEETRALYHLRVLQVVAEEMEGRHGGSFTELLVLSQLIPGLAALLGRSSRWCMNLQSSAVSFLAALLNTGCVRLLHLLTGKDGLIEACMRLFLECAQRNNVLSASLGRLFFDLCTLVHLGKRQSTELVTPKTSFAVALLEDGLDSRIGSSATDADLSRQPTEHENIHLCQETALILLRSYGDQLAMKSPYIAENLRHVLEETPEEAQQADTEASTIASTVERMPATALSEYDALAVDFALEIPSSRSRSHSPPNGSSGDPPYQLLFGFHGEDSLSEFSLDDDRASNDSGNISSDKCDHLQENEEAGGYAALRFSEENGRAEGAGAGTAQILNKHSEKDESSEVDDEEWMENEEESLHSKRHRSEESIGSSIAY
ncbi:unnamed protein product [Phytomonas sp. EM1]|nr:unnamed protein product [Phytomonas sp. EM1]|eukprot:CCW65545.1 unnamed protein product [Phytomonas sp. isolate EM1]